MSLFYDFIRYGPLFRRSLTGQCQSPCTRVPASASSTLDYSRQELTGQSQPTNKGLMNRRADSRDACTTIPFRSDGRSFGRSVCSRRRGKGGRSAPARGSPFVDQISFTRILLLVRPAALYAKRSPRVSAKCCSDVPCVQEGAKTMRFLFSNKNSSQRGSPQLTAFFVPLFFFFFFSFLLSLMFSFSGRHRNLLDAVIAARERQSQRPGDCGAAH